MTTDLRVGPKGLSVKNSTSEIYIRNMFDAWLTYMTGTRLAARAPQGAVA